MKKYIIPIILPQNNKKDWIYQNQRIPNVEQKELTKELVKEIIYEHIEKMDEHFNVEVSFIGSDFSELEENIQIEILELLASYIRMQKINSIKISLRPNNVNKKILKKLKKYKVKTIELDINSTNDYILNKIGMKYSFKDVKKASKLIKWYGFKLGHQIMIGLPESTKIDELNTAKNLIKLKTSMVSINPVLVIKGTPLEKLVNQREYKPLTVVQAIETCKELVKVFNQKNIEINAIGFEPLDNANKQDIFSENVISGPFHPAFRQLVESNLWYDAIVNKIKMLNAKVMEVEITVNPNDFNNVVGYKMENIEKLKDIYDVDLIVTKSKEIKQGKSKIEITKIFDGIA